MGLYQEQVIPIHYHCLTLLHNFLFAGDVFKDEGFLVFVEGFELFLLIGDNLIRLA